METVDEAIARHKAEIAGLRQQKERSALKTAEYQTKLLLEILDRLEDLNARVAFVEQEILSARIESANEQCPEKPENDGVQG